MKKKVIDELNNINDDLIDKSMSIDSKEKLMEAKSKEKKGLGAIFGWLTAGVVTVGLIVFGVLFFTNHNVLSNNTNKTNEVEVDISKYLSEYTMKGNGLEEFDLYFMKLNNDGKNKVYSPLSIKYALEMLSEGAKGDTKAQIDAILGDYKAGKYFNNENISFANAMFINESVKNDVNKEYTKNLMDKFNAEVIYDSFKDAKKINNWVSEKTLKLIGDLLTDDAVRDKLYFLVNALAIDMEWTNRIAEDGIWVDYANEDYSFFMGPYNSGYDETMIKFNGKKEVPMLHFASVFNNYDIVKALGEDYIKETLKKAYAEYKKTNEYDPDVEPEELSEEYFKDYIKALNNNYHRSANSTEYMFYVDDNLKVIAKDLKKYGSTQLQYVQIMPTKENLDKYIEKMTAEDLNKIINNLKETKNETFKEGVITEINGYIAPFKMDYELDLTSNLNTLGVKNIFDFDKADLSGIMNGTHAISDVLHKATIELTNDGIKAAAATAIGGLGDDISGFRYAFEVPVEKIDLTFDKPFIYLIRDKVTGEIWFAGSTYEIISPEFVLAE